LFNSAPNLSFEIELRKPVQGFVPGLLLLAIHIVVCRERLVIVGHQLQKIERHTEDVEWLNETRLPAGIRPR
jgi:hypothetical protein